MTSRRRSMFIVKHRRAHRANCEIPITNVITKLFTSITFEYYSTESYIKYTG